MRILGLSTVALASLLLVPIVPAQPTWQREHATWLTQHTAAASNGVLGLTDPWWRPDCKLVLDPRGQEQPDRVYALSAVRRVERDATRPEFIRITFDPDAPLGVVHLQTVIADPTDVVDRVREYAAACGATVPPSAS